MKDMNKYLLLLLFIFASVSSFAQNKVAAFPVKQESASEYERMIKNLQFEQAQEKIKKDIAQAKKKKTDTTEQENLLERCNRGIQMLRGTDRVVVIDSVVMDKRYFLEAYNYSEDLGKISLSKDGKTTVFETQRGSRIYKPEISGSSLQLTSYYMESGKPTNKKNITGLEVDGDLNYPSKKKTFAMTAPADCPAHRERPQAITVTSSYPGSKKLNPQGRKGNPPS